MGVTEEPIEPLSTDRFADVLGAEQYASFTEAVGSAATILGDRVVYNVNSTARGGGVAEMLRSLIAYARGTKVDARWLVIDGDPGFFTVTKRIHNRLHGSVGDGGPLGEAERAVYERALRDDGEDLLGILTDRDVVLLHDPQTAGLIPVARAAGAIVIWRCHVGLDMPNDVARETWDFLLPYVQQADATIFSREAFTWKGLEHDRIHVVAPSIDAFSPKNQDLDDATVTAILAAARLVPGGTSGTPEFTRLDGGRATVTRHAEYREGDPPPAGAPLVVQVSRWDRLKDPVGVIRGFARFVAPDSEAHLIVAGPSVAAVADDPEGAETLAEAQAAWSELAPDLKDRVHLATLPMDDGDENAAIVNALQRRATVIVQKSLAEGFGLTVAEGMWKGKPVVASRIGGIQDQISDGETGVLVDDPTDLEAYGAAVLGLLQEPDRAERIGAAARERVRDEFLGARHLMQYLELIEALLASRPGHLSA